MKSDYSILNDLYQLQVLDALKIHAVSMFKSPIFTNNSPAGITHSILKVFQISAEVIESNAFGRSDFEAQDQHIVKKIIRLYRRVQKKWTIS